jgi:hypothetical protein
MNKPKDAKAIEKFKLLYKRIYFHSNEKLTWKYPAEIEFLEGMKNIFNDLISEATHDCENERDRKWLKFVDEKKKEKANIKQMNCYEQMLKDREQACDECMKWVTKLQKENTELKEKVITQENIINGLNKVLFKIKARDK